MTMTEEKLFSERQHFRQIWLWLLLIGINGLFAYGLYKQIFLGQPFGDNPAPDGVLIALVIFNLLLATMFYLSRLDTEIKSDGIYFRFYPFQWSYKRITWDNISNAFVRQYSPIGEYGGWGLRLGIFGKGRAYNVSGNKGLQLVYTNGKRFLLGTQKPDEVERTLKQLGRLTNPA
jgi:hypothetical protein